MALSHRLGVIMSLAPAGASLIDLGQGRPSITTGKRKNTHRSITLSVAPAGARSPFLRQPVAYATG